jgi:hypothetical protein
MAVDLKLQNPGNPYDSDDPDNYLNRDQKAENSNIVPWMLGGMFAAATLIGLFFAEESPLTDPPRTTQTTENIPAHPAPAHLQSN